MNISQWENKIIACLEGELSTNEQDKLMDQISRDADLKSMWTDYSALYTDLDDIEDDIPSDTVSARYQEWLDTQTADIAEDDDTPIISLVNWKFLASVAALFLCVLGYWNITEQNSEMNAELAALHTMMDTDSPSQRIKAIRISTDLSKNDLDAQLIVFLLNTLETDPSSNVRLATIETLSSFIDHEEVRGSLIKSLGTESDGAVKLAIMHALGQRQDQKIKQSLENIVNDDSQEDFIKNEAHLQLIRLDNEVI